MEVTSQAFKDGEMIPAKYSRRGGDSSPPLTFEGVPAGAKSLALICHDPDAPREEGWTHWVVWNIPASSKGFPEGAVPDNAAQGKTDWGENHWGGPQPPSGVHHYIFYLYALDTKLDLPSTTTRSELEQELPGHVLASATLTGLYSAK